MAICNKCGQDGLFTKEFYGKLRLDDSHEAPFVAHLCFDCYNELISMLDNSVSVKIEAPISEDLEHLLMYGNDILNKKEN